MKAVRIEQPGGPEVMQLQDVDLAAPDAGQVRIRHAVVGLNYIDTYHRSGLYPPGSAVRARPGGRRRRGGAG